ncbi:MAG: ExeA family protein [Lachnospiraceae bacterium]
MFEAFYEMSATPFTRGLPSTELYMPPQLLEMKSRLNYVAERQLFAVLTGDCGTGKTTVVRKFADDLNPNQYRFLYLSDALLTPREFYRGLLEQMGFAPRFNRGDARRQLHEEVEIMRAVHGVQPVCICDESHLMSREMLEEIRFLLNTHLDSKSPMGLILVGQTELRKKLQMQAYTAIRQRIDVQSVLNHYDRAQTGAYISRQLSYAGCSRDLFTDAAVDAIHQSTSGTARMIDKLCTSLLLYASQSKMRLIDDHAVKLVLDCEFT